MLLLDDEQKKKGVISASAGNHAQAIAFASKELDIPATIIVPKNTPKTKINVIKTYGVKLKVKGNIYDDAEAFAIQKAQETNLHYLSPYNHPDVIAGQGTVGFECLEQNPELEVLLIPLSGGSLFSGVAIAVKKINPSIICYGIQTEACPVMFESLKQGCIVDVPMKHSIAEGLHGGVEKGSITFPYIQKYCENVLLVSEKEIKDTIVELIQRHHIICEGAGAVGLAALKRYRMLFKEKKVGIIISGGNLDLTDLKSFLK